MQYRSRTLCSGQRLGFVCDSVASSVASVLYWRDKSLCMSFVYEERHLWSCARNSFPFCRYICNKEVEQTFHARLNWSTGGQEMFLLVSNDKMLIQYIRDILVFHVLMLTTKLCCFEMHFITPSVSLMFSQENKWVSNSACPNNLSLKSLLFWNFILLYCFNSLFMWQWH